MSVFCHDVLTSLTLKLTYQVYIHLYRQLSHIYLKLLIPYPEQCEIQAIWHRNCALKHCCISLLPEKLIL